MTTNIAVVAERYVAIAFQLIGIKTFPVFSGDEARKVITDLANEGCQVIYLTESLAKDIPDTIAYYDTQLLPAIVLIPSTEGPIGIGTQRLKSHVEKAIGQDILD